MGMVEVKLSGSFGNGGVSFIAEQGGHAMAISRAISFLNGQLPDAIRLDHALHDKNERPPQSDFGWVPEMGKSIG